MQAPAVATVRLSTAALVSVALPPIRIMLALLAMHALAIVIITPLVVIVSLPRPVLGMVHVPLPVIAAVTSGLRTMLVTLVRRVILIIHRVWHAQYRSLAATEARVNPMVLVSATAESLLLQPPRAAGTAMRVFQDILPLWPRPRVLVVQDRRLALFSLAGA